MGQIAHTVYAGLGEESVIGVIPEALQPREISGETVGEIRVVPDMHTRKVNGSQSWTVCNACYTSLSLMSMHSTCCCSCTGHDVGRGGCLHWHPRRVWHARRGACALLVGAQYLSASKIVVGLSPLIRLHIVHAACTAHLLLALAAGRDDHLAAAGPAHKTGGAAQHEGLLRPPAGLF